MARGSALAAYHGAVRLHELKRLFVGTPLPTAQSRHERLGKASALAVFASDPLSSVAYATEAILLVLILAGRPALSYSLPIGVGIAALILIVVASYRQTIRAYPQGGGAYIVAKDNLGVLPALLAGAALLIDYVLTVAVSAAAGVDADHLGLSPSVPLPGVALLAGHRGASPSPTCAASASRARSSPCPPISSSPASSPWSACGMGEAATGRLSRGALRSRIRRAWRASASSCSCAPSPPAAPRSPAWRRCPTACRPSSRPRRTTRGSS